MTDKQEATSANNLETRQSDEHSVSMSELSNHNPQSGLKNNAKQIDVKPYDLAIKHNVIPERLMALEIVNERFARQFRIGLFNLLRRNTDVITAPIESQTFNEFSQNASTTQLNLVHLNPLRGTCLFALSPELVFIVVDTLFGGEGRFNRIDELEGREFTHTEQQIIKRVLELALNIYQTAWADIYPIETEYVRSEMHSKFTNITSSPEDIVLTSSFTIEVGQFKAKFCICIPYAMVEPIKEVLVTPPIEQQSYQDDKAWLSTLTSGIKHSTIELVANFAEIETTINKLLALKVNDVLIIDKPTLLDVTVGGVPVLKGLYGKVNKQYAIQVEQVINPVLEQLNEEILND